MIVQRLKAAQKNGPTNGVKPPKILVGTKADLEKQYQVTTQEVHEVCAKYETECLWISNKTGKNVNELFFFTLWKILQENPTLADSLPLNEEKPGAPVDKGMCSCM